MHCCCRSKDCSDIRWIHHVFQNGNPVLSLAKFPEIFQWSAFQCTKHSSRQLKSCQLRKDSKLCCKNRSACILKSCKNFLRLFIFFHLLLFNQNRYWNISGIQRPSNHFRTFCNKKSIFRTVFIQKLCFRITCVDVQFRCVKVVDFYNI